MKTMRIYNLRSGAKMVRNNFKIIFFDLETTGFNQFHNNIIEIAAKDNKNNEFHSLVDPEQSISKKITSITNITNSMVKGKPKINTVLEDFIKFCFKDTKKNENVYLVAHNGNAFDRVFLERKMFECCLEIPDWKYIDSLHLAQYLLPNKYSHSLKNLCKHWNIIQKNAHRAMSDVEDLEKIFELLIHTWEYNYGDTTIEEVCKFLSPKK